MRLASLARGTGLVLVALLSLELACRVEDWVRYRTPFFSPFTSEDELRVRDADGMHGRPNARFGKWVLNSWGMRGPQVALAKPERSLRIVTVGASETFGLYESAGREFPRQLEDSLAAYEERECGAAGVRVEVLNAALPGMTLPTITQDVQRRLAPLHPDAVVIYPSPSFYLDNDPPHVQRPDSSANAGFISPTKALAPRALTRVRNALKGAVPMWVQRKMRDRTIAAERANHPAGWAFDDLPADRVAAFDADMRQLVGAVRAIGAEPVLVTHANQFMGDSAPDGDALVSWQKFYPRATGRLLVAFDSVAREVTLRIAADSSLRVADVAAREASDRSGSFSDFVHFSDHGAALAAATIREPLAGLLPRCAIVTGAIRLENALRP